MTNMDPVRRRQMAQARQRKFRATEKGRAAMIRANEKRKAKPGYLERQREMMRQHRLRPGVKEQAAERRSHPEAKRRSRERAYSLPTGWLESKMEEQGNACGVCRRPFVDGLIPCIDHDHACCSSPSRSCGRCVRGVLCRQCNAVEGYVTDTILAGLADYRRKHAVEVAS